MKHAAAQARGDAFFNELVESIDDPLTGRKAPSNVVGSAAGRAVLRIGMICVPFLYKSIRYSKPYWRHS
jgi:hypothetical protein